MSERARRWKRDAAVTHPRQRIVGSFASLATYRLEVMLLLRAHFGDRLQLITGDRAADHSVHLMDKNDLDRTIVKNFYLPGQLLLQRGGLRAAWQSDVLLLDLNPRVILSWPLLVGRRALGRPTVLWGHAWPRRGRASTGEPVRNLMRSLSTGLIAYTVDQARALHENHPSKRIFAAPNAVMHADQCRFTLGTQRDSILYVGRLVAAKKPHLLVEAFERLANVHQNIRLKLIGGGPEHDALRSQIAASPYAQRIQMLGPITDFERLRSVYSTAIVSVSPGYVGLAATQSFGFGVPMVVSRTEPHAPEIEAVKEGFNAELFETDSSDALAVSLTNILNHHNEWRERGTDIAAWCAKEYSVERMAQGIIDALEAFSCA